MVSILERFTKSLSEVIERLKIQKTFMVARGTMMMRKQGQGMSKDMLRVHLVREQMDKQIEDWFIFTYRK